jgi:3-oxoacyl-[acyl-carrier protein] reductase
LSLAAGRLSGRIALVTGGARGIGRAIAERFLGEGARVAVWDVDPETTGSWPEPAPALSRVDVADAAAVAAAAGRLATDLGGLDILVNNAGVNLSRSPAVGEVRDDEWRRILDVNLSGVLHVTQAVLPLMLGRPAGRIVNFSSVLALAGFPGQTAYAASKAGILGLTRVWARELGPRGITVNCLVPGYIETAMNNPAAVDFRRAVVARTALRRLGAPDDVARVCLFLASDDAAFVTGAAIPVDGGLSA